MSYKSPIDIMMGAIQTEIVNGTFKAVQEYGIHVDKGEMIKALKYDRGQYEQGLADGYFAARNKIVRCKDCKYWVYEDDYGMFCSHWGSTLAEAKAEDYCSYGERKEQG